MATIQGIYIALFGRPADPLGLAYFNEVTQNGADLTAIGDLSATAEYQDRFAGLNNVQIVTKIYQDLFGRDPDAAGLAFFVAALNSGTYSINNIAIAILDGARGDDALVVANKTAAANLFTAEIDTAIEIGSYVGDDAAAIGRAYLAGVTADPTTVPTTADAAAAVQAVVDLGTLGNVFDVVAAEAVSTGGPDVAGGRFTSNDNDTITVTDAYTGAANINGNLGRDTVNIANLAANATANLTNIEVLNVTASAAAILDLVNVNGLQEVWNNASAADLTVDNIDAGVEVGIRGATAASTFILDDATGTSDSVNLSLVNATTTAVTIAGVETLNVDVDGASTVGSLIAADAETVNITGTGNLTITLGALTADATVDASGHVGVLNVTIDAAQDGLTISGGASNDVFTVASGAEGVVITGGAGNDHFNLNLTNIQDITSNATILDDVIRITDFAAANDLLDINLGGGVAASLDNIERGNISAAANLQGALNVAAAAAGVDGADYVTFQYGSSTYVYVDADLSGTVNVGDGVVELVGFTGTLDASNFTTV